MSKIFLFTLETQRHPRGPNKFSCFNIVISRGYRKNIGTDISSHKH